MILGLVLFVAGWRLTCRTDVRHPTLAQDVTGFIGVAVSLGGLGRFLWCLGALL